MADTILISSAELAGRNKAHFPNESAEYRQVRNNSSRRSSSSGGTSSASPDSDALFPLAMEVYSFLFCSSA
jgi:hypothetical protein